MQRNRRFSLGNNTVTLDRDDLLLTRDLQLRAGFVNLINLQNLELFGLVFREAWKEPELFAHLIGEKTIPTHELKTVSAWTMVFFKMR